MKRRDINRRDINRRKKKGNITSGCRQTCELLVQLTTCSVEILSFYFGIDKGKITNITNRTKILYEKGKTARTTFNFIVKIVEGKTA